jgi:uncharacterized protein YjiS (DUF1127 family)
MHTAETRTLSAARGHRPSGLLAWLRLALAARRQRHDLSRLPPEVLRDIGITAEEARREAGKPVWDVPSHWLR